MTHVAPPPCARCACHPVASPPYTRPMRSGSGAAYRLCRANSCWARCSRRVIACGWAVDAARVWRVGGPRRCGRHAMPTWLHGRLSKGGLSARSAPAEPASPTRNRFARRGGCRARHRGPAISRSPRPGRPREGMASRRARSHDDASNVLVYPRYNRCPFAYGPASSPAIYLRPWRRDFSGASRFRRGGGGSRSPDDLGALEEPRACALPPALDNPTAPASRDPPLRDRIALEPTRLLEFVRGPLAKWARPAASCVTPLADRRRRERGCKLRSDLVSGASTTARSRLGVGRRVRCVPRTGRRD